MKRTHDLKTSDARVYEDEDDLPLSVFIMPSDDSVTDPTFVPKRLTKAKKNVSHCLITYTFYQLYFGFCQSS